jgi:hypothetical protein
MRTKLLLIGCMIAPVAFAQTHSEKIVKELSFEKVSAANALIVSNINGNITVVGYDGDKIQLEATKTIHAKTEARLEEGKVEIQLGIIDRADTLIVYVRDGCNEFRRDVNGRHRNGRRQGGWGYHSTMNNCHLTYDYKMDFTLKVPVGLNVNVSTINNGEVTVEKVNGLVKAANINGGISLMNLKSQADAHTINGDVKIEYTHNPGRDCSFYTLNGDIHASFQPGLAANMSFESFNGSLYTNLAALQTLPLEIEPASHGEGVKYKIKGHRYQIGKGGPLLDFETFNGNVYLKEIETK